MKWMAIDFEYNRSKNKQLHLVCAAVTYTSDKGLRKKTFWLNTESNHGEMCLSQDERLKKCIEDRHKEGYVFFAYNLVAEARCFLTLGLDPLKYNWVDIYLEYRCLTNHNHEFMYGDQYKDGRVKFTTPPKSKWKQSEEESMKANNDKPSHSMVSAAYKLLGVKLDSGFKDAMRDLIISAPPQFESGEAEEIMEYCLSDTIYLYPMFKKIVAEYERLLRGRLDKKQLKRDMKGRAEYACRTAMMEQHGYPIDYEATKNFSSQVPAILFACQKDIMEQFPDRKPFWNLNRKTGLYAKNQKAIRVEIEKWLVKNPRARWTLTDGGTSGNVDLSLSLKAFSRHFNYTHSYPRGNYFAQIVRYLKLTQSLNGFTSGGKTNFWDYVGEDDGFVRPYMGIYTAQSSRSQPKATSLINLKSAWMRCLVQAPKDYALGSIDYKSQEFLIAALMSGDDAMLKAYLTGDVYLSFGKSIGFIPQDGTKAKFKKERDMMKPIVLGIQFDMSMYGLSKELTEKWGHRVSEQEAQGYIEGHQTAFPDFWAWKKEMAENYVNFGHVRFADGYYMWGDNPNSRSSSNARVQGMGAVIMRKAVAIAQNLGVDIIFTLHDALYMMSKTEDLKEMLQTMARAMDEAFRFYFPKNRKMAQVGLEADIWSRDFPKETVEVMWDYTVREGDFPMEVKRQQTYIDPRGAEQYEYFKKYFNKPELADMEF
jgi:hypothetical protein